MKRKNNNNLTQTSSPSQQAPQPPMTETSLAHAKSFAEFLAYHQVTHAEAKASPAYYQVMSAMYQEQAARMIQRTFRKNKGHDFPKYKETLTKGRPRLDFLSEPRNNMLAEQIAEKIKAGEWEALPFEQFDFERALYQSLRLQLITTHDLATAIWLYHAKKNLGNGGAIKQHEFFIEDNLCDTTKNEFAPGPYRFDSIPYKTNQHITDFKQALAELAPHERRYFSINLDLRKEALLLAHLCKITAITYRPLGEFLKNFFRKTVKPFHASLYCAKVDKFMDLENGTTRIAIGAQLTQFINVQPDDENDHMDDIRFIASILKLDTSLPNFFVSPDYQEENAGSPGLCLVIFHVSAMVAFQRALFGEKEMVHPYFTASKITTRMIRDLDGAPALFNLEQAHRPVELPNQDVVGADAPHGYQCQAGINLLHDNFHWFNNSENMFKDFFRYVRQLFMQQTGFDMSKAVWAFSDMDTRVGSIIRTTPPALLQLQKATTLLETPFLRFFHELWLADEVGDQSLLVVIDLILHPARWATLLQTPNAYELFKLAFSDADFDSIYQKMKTIIGNVAPDHSAYQSSQVFFNAPAVKSHSYYLAAYRTNNHPLVEEANALSFAHFFGWSRNEGLFLCGAASPLKNMTPACYEQQLNALLQAFKTNQLTPKA